MYSIKCLSHSNHSKGSYLINTVSACNSQTKIILIPCRDHNIFVTFAFFPVMRVRSSVAPFEIRKSDKRKCGQKRERRRKKTRRGKKTQHDCIHLKTGTIGNAAAGADKRKVQKKKILTLISMSAEVSGGCEAMAFEWHIDGHGSHVACQESRR